MSARHLLPGRPSQAHAARLRQLLNLLSRPAMDEATRRAVVALTGAADWQPVAWLPSLAALLPLYYTHSRACGVEWAALFHRAPDAGTAEATCRGALIAYIQRQGLLRGLLHAMQERGLAAPMVMKGAAVAHLYQSPALRTMCDVDMIVETENRHAVEALLLSQGWSPDRRLRGVFRHPGGLHLDLHLGQDAFALETLRGATETHLEGVGIIRLPHPARHLCLLAMHAAHHDGDRLWRDVADARALLGALRGQESLAAAVRDAIGAGHGSAVVAFLTFFQGVTNELEFDPLDLLTDKAARQSAADYLRLYEWMAVEAAEPVALHLLRQGTAGAAGYWRAAAALYRRPPGAEEGDPRDSLPATPAGLAEASPRSRRRMIARVFAELVRGDLRHYLRLARLQKRLSLKRQPFEAADIAWRP